MATLRGQIAVLGHPLAASDIWHTYTARGRTSRNAIARLRPTPQSKAPYPGLSYLAHAVIKRAAEDATPETDRGGKPFRDDAKRRYVQCEALIWLSFSDPDLLYWCELADYPIHRLHHRFRPLLMKFILEQPDIAARFSLPEWCRASA